MSKQLINAYRNQLDKIIRFGGTKNETSVRRAFISLINSYAEKKNLLLVEEVGVMGKAGKTVYPDGTLKNSLRIEFGYWESKDEKDTLEDEVHQKLNVKGYPDSNILFEDTREAILFQEGNLVQKVSLDDDDALDRILNAFVNYVPAKFHKYSEALEQFTNDVPTIVQELRDLLEKEAETNSTFRDKRDYFYALAQGEINPEITLEDVREMIIQHILTEDIFNNVFGNSNFHRFNNIAKELEAVIDTFMTYAVRQSHLASIKSYYDTIRDAASGIADHHEKQKFLKNIYENFYKVYNPKGADRLGVVYTPNEIVRFMIESTDYLLEKHFNRSLADKNVEILDPATGTGTFVAELIEYISPNQLPYKYEHEIHANEVAILPYYIANLNIEYTYAQKMAEHGGYKEFVNICFVDTLDNLEGLVHEGQHSFSFGLSSENAVRIKRQNEKKISVIIGNPPYNANQANFNDFNKNRLYDHIDRRIKESYVKESTAQKTKVYDTILRTVF